MTTLKDYLTWQKKNADLGSIFDAQIQRLKERQIIPQWIISMLTSQREWVLKESIRAVPIEGRIPFLPVIPLRHVRIQEQIIIICNGYRLGHTKLDPLLISSSIFTPWWPYFIFDVDQGEKIRGHRKDIARNALAREVRSPLTTQEMLALCLHTGLGSKRRIAALGSYYNKETQTIILHTDKEERPQLSCLSKQAIHEPWDYPSLKRRIGIPMVMWAD